MAAKIELAIPASEIRSVCIAFVDFDPGREGPDLGVDLMKRWNPRVYGAWLAPQPRSLVRVVTAPSNDAMLANLKTMHDSAYADCDVAIQIGGFSILRKSTGKMQNVPCTLATFYTSPTKSHLATVGEGLDLTLVPLGKTEKPGSQLDAILNPVPAAQREKLRTIRATLDALVLTDPDRAEAELNQHNISRRTVWGDQAAVIPIARGTADAALRVVYSCIANDFKLRQAREIQVEEIQAVLVSDSIQSKLDELTPGVRQAYETALAKNLEKTPITKRVRKIVISVYFPQAFGKHEIVRVAENEFLAMPCTYEALPKIAPPVANEKYARLAQAMKRKPVKTFLLGCLALYVVGLALSVIIALVAAHRSPAKTIVAGSALPTMVMIGNDSAPTPAAVVDVNFFGPSGAPLSIGRQFLASDFEMSASPVAILSDDLWNKRYARHPNIIGLPISIDGRTRIIVGIAGQGFSEPRGAMLWLPFESQRPR
jgi:hypothetical protein